MKKRNILTDYQENFVDDLVTKSEKEEISEINNVLNEFMDDDELEDLFG
ncbi:MAG TPA: hypothetical protein VMX55_02430 [candidate division Zixibacteria bacterium]|nr:hypothetical protein [candidate division Zixibacteria bacterium]